MTIKDAWKITKQSFADFFNCNILKLAASLAYFTIFSLPGLLIIIIWVSNLFFGRESVEEALYYQIEGFVGSSAAHDIQEAMRNAAVSAEGNIATILGLLALIFGATSVFAEIQDSINTIWRLKAKTNKGKGLLKLLFTRLLSFSMIITLGFILLVALVINGVLEYFLNYLMGIYPQLTVVIVYIVNIAFTFVITALIFAAIFKVLPDARIKWKHVRIGACVTAVLFMGGRMLIGYFLAENKMSSAYGAAGSLIIVLLWVYYSALILYFGAAFTHAYVMNKGSRIYPNQYAVWVQQIEVESEKSIAQQPVEAKAVIEAPEQKSEPKPP